ncbi:MAG TPA: DUF3137 domain-containing protein [Alphaproteobacteria bacterium]|jgi:hypothetical protein
MSENPATRKMHEALAVLRPALEARRKKFHRFLIFGAAAIVLCVAGYVLTRPAGHFDMPLVAVVFAALLPSVIYYHILSHFYRKRGKAQVVGALAAGIGFNYHQSGVFDLDAVMRHKIIPPFTMRSVEDGFEGNYEGVGVALQEVRLADVVRDPQYKGRRRELPVFQGLIIRLHLRKAFEGHTVIMPNNGLLTWFRTKFSAFQKVNLVAPQFERLYDVMGTDQVEARVVMNPAFIERFLEAGPVMKARYMEVSFLGNEVLLAVARNKPLFEFDPLWQRVTNERLYRMGGELAAVLALIDVLRLNRQIAT